MSYPKIGANIIGILALTAFFWADDTDQLRVKAEAMQPPVDMTKEVSEIIKGGNQFALDLYRQLRSQEGNLFFSPSSISTALAMTYAGAAGETEVEMAKTLHVPMPQDELHEGMRALQASWAKAGQEQGVRLNLANRLWGHEGYVFLPELISPMKKTST